MSQPQARSYREMMEAQGGDHRGHLGDPLIEVDPKHLHARTRHHGTFSIATLSTMAAWVGKEKKITNPQGVKFDLGTLGGLMDYWLFNYEAVAPSLDGKSREEYVRVASFIAVGQGDESGVLTTNLLNEGSKNLSGKASKTK
jgi:hypothetical protein